MISVKIVKAKYKADFKVALTDDERQQKNAYALIGCRLAEGDETADMCVYITARPQEADIVITPSNFPIRVPCGVPRKK